MTVYDTIKFKVSARLLQNFKSQLRPTTLKRYHYCLEKLGELRQNFSSDKVYKNFWSDDFFFVRVFLTLVAVANELKRTICMLWWFGVVLVRKTNKQALMLIRSSFAYGHCNRLHVFLFLVGPLS